MELSIEEISKDEWKRIKKHNYKKSFKKKAHLIKEEKAKAKDRTPVIGGRLSPCPAL